MYNMLHDSGTHSLTRNKHRELNKHGTVIPPSAGIQGVRKCPFPVLTLERRKGSWRRGSSVSERGVGVWRMERGENFQKAQCRGQA